MELGWKNVQVSVQSLRINRGESSSAGGCGRSLCPEVEFSLSTRGSVFIRRKASRSSRSAVRCDSRT